VLAASGVAVAATDATDAEADAETEGAAAAPQPVMAARSSIMAVMRASLRVVLPVDVFFMMMASFSVMGLSV
jgi:4-hydroxyphenylpyruvate dioxygenase-like putative hemolysin